MATKKLTLEPSCTNAQIGKSSQGLTRRKFLKNAALTAGAVAVGTELGFQTPAFADTTTRYAKVIDLRKCVGCKACTVACKAENHVPPEMFYTKVDEEEVGAYPDARRTFMHKSCNHCDRPTCIPVCPVNATWKRSDGVVVIDYETCIGCKKCVTACPYQARTFDEGLNYHEQPTPYEEKGPWEYGEYHTRAQGEPPIGKVRKCSFCLHRVLKGLGPACAETCIGGAIHFGDLNDPDAVCMIHGEPLQELLESREYFRLLEDFGNEPNVYYLS